MNFFTKLKIVSKVTKIIKLTKEVISSIDSHKKAKEIIEEAVDKLKDLYKNETSKEVKMIEKLLDEIKALLK